MLNFRTWRRGALLAFMVLAWPAALTGAQAETFLSTLADVPLMDGLTEAPDLGTVFDKPGGRIVETFAEGATTRDAVRRYYQETLPELGWRPLDEKSGQLAAKFSFERDGERLCIDFTEVRRKSAAGALRVRFSVAPLN